MSKHIWRVNVLYTTEHDKWTSWAMCDTIEIFLFFVTSHVPWRPPSLPFSGYQVSLLEVKQQVRDVDH